MRGEALSLVGQASRLSMKIAETFVSVQGEGRLTGTPSWFCRVSGCNLRCSWCDTPYASWAPEGDVRTVDALLAEAREVMHVSPSPDSPAQGEGARHAVLTGGEPMLFDAIEALSRGLRELGMHITIETAGTIHRSPSALACDLMSISPKLSNSTPGAGDPRDPDGAWRARHEARRLDLSVLQRLIDDYPSRQLKFVVAQEGDIEEIDALLANLHGFAASDVMLMPEGVTVPKPADAQWVQDVCAARGWVYCPRLHIELFGNVRGT